MVKPVVPGLCRVIVAGIVLLSLIGASCSGESEEAESGVTEPTPNEQYARDANQLTERVQSAVDICDPALDSMSAIETPTTNAQAVAYTALYIATLQKYAEFLDDEIQVSALENGTAWLENNAQESADVLSMWQSETPPSEVYTEEFQLALNSIESKSTECQDSGVIEDEPANDGTTSDINEESQELNN